MFIASGLLERLAVHWLLRALKHARVSFYLEWMENVCSMRTLAASLKVGALSFLYLAGSS